MVIRRWSGNYTNPSGERVVCIGFERKRLLKIR